MAPYYLHPEDDVVAERGSLAVVRKTVDAAPADWLSIRLLADRACAILFESADLAQLSARLRMMYYEMPVDWLIDEHIRFKERTGRGSFVNKGLFDHIGVHSSLTGQVR